MTLAEIRQRLAALPPFEALHREADALRPGSALRIRGAAGSLPAFLLADMLERRGGSLIALLAESESADYVRSDLEQLLGSDERVLFFPPTGHVPYDPDQLSETAPLVARADALQRLGEGFDGILVTSVEAISELVPAPEAVGAETMTVRTGQTLEPEGLMDRLIGQGFEPVEFVARPGEVALRGGILDVFPFAGDYPVRIEFFGDEVDALRAFDPLTQRSVSRMEAARLVPNLDAPDLASGTATTALDFLPPGVPIALFDAARLVDATGERFEAAAARFHERRAAHPDEDAPPPEARYLTAAGLQQRLNARARLLFGTFAGESERTIDLDARPQPPFHGDVRRFREHVLARKVQGETTVLLCDSAAQRDRLFELLGGDLDEDRAPDADLLVESLHEGFEVVAARLGVYTDHQLFNRYHRPTARKRRRLTGGLTLRDVQALKPGDFVVHVDFGIGKFAGLQRITVRGQQQEAVRLLFASGDELFVNVGALHKLHRYTGKEGHQPKLTKLGTGAWERLKARTKKRVKDIARDLIGLYAARKGAPGYAFQRDTTWQSTLR